MIARAIPHRRLRAGQAGRCELAMPACALSAPRCPVLSRPRGESQSERIVIVAALAHGYADAPPRDSADLDAAPRHARDLDAPHALRRHAKRIAPPSA